MEIEWVEMLADQLAHPLVGWLGEKKVVLMAVW
jgi:hypothetical protein